MMDFEKLRDGLKNESYGALFSDGSGWEKVYIGDSQTEKSVAISAEHINKAETVLDGYFSSSRYYDYNTKK